jgi:S-(hydroxymethyl)glutathione dehydrogenase/alcohol dehydrogenase
MRLRLDLEVAMRAAVLQEVGADSVEVRDDVETLEPGPGEVLVRIRATGVCHSDLSALNGTIPQPTPAVLGHEGAGEVVAVGPGVSDVSVGDHVIVAWIPPCGKCKFCLGGQAQLCIAVAYTTGMAPRFRLGEIPVFGFAGTGTFAEQVVLPQQSVVVIPSDVPFEIGSLIGCGVMTGVGAAINAARVVPGSSVVVFGCGGVGVSVIQGARLAGAAEIVAVDVVPSKLDDAKRFGATHGVGPDGLEAVKSELTGGDGFDYAFEAIGRPETIRAAYDAARRGGTACIVGVGRAEEKIELNAFELFYMEKKLIGTLYGSADVRRDFHRIIRLWKAGRLDLEGMISKRIDLSEVNEAFDAMVKGQVIRQVIELG